MSRYKLMNAEELAEFIYSKGIDEEYSFATGYPEEISSEELDNHEHNIETWYGIKKTKLFDATVIAVGHYGGGNCEVYDIDQTNEYLPGDLRDYMETYLSDSTTYGLVCVDTEKVVYNNDTKRS